MIHWPRNSIESKEQWKGALISAGVTLVISLVFWNFRFPLSIALERISYDQPFLLGPNLDPQEVVIVYQDDSSYEKLGQSYGGWSRRLYAKLVERLTEEDVRAAVFDVTFPDPGSDASVDREFARAIQANGRVILAADLIGQDLSAPGTGVRLRSETMLPPTPVLDDGAADIGFPQLDQDSDFEVRRNHHHGEVHPALYSLSWAAARFLGVPITQVPAKTLPDLYVHYYGGPMRIPHYSFWQLIEPGWVARGALRGKVVFIGAHVLTRKANERKDEFRNPYTNWAFTPRRARFMPGVEVHATLFLNLLRREWLRRLNPGTEGAVISISAGLIGLGIGLLRPLGSTVAGLGFMASYAALAHGLVWTHHLWFAWAIPAYLSVGVAWACSVIVRSISLYVQKRLLEQTLKAYLPPKLVRNFANRRDSRFFQPGARKQDISILFSDISGFTTISEGVDSSQLARFMNQYFHTIVTRGIHATEGTLVKYVGDGVFAFWNAPEPQKDHARQACLAALEIQAQRIPFEDGTLIQTRIGLHTGEANVGNFGTLNRVDYTAMGENVNLASRLEGLNKYLHTDVLVSRATLQAAGEGFVTRYLGRFRLKGFQKSIDVHELLGNPRDPQTPPQWPWLAPFGEAIQSFRSGDLKAAKAHFQTALSIRPNDGPSRFYLENLGQLGNRRPGKDWSGEIRLSEK